MKRLTLSAKKGRQGKTPSKLYEFAPMDLGGESANKDEAVPVKASGSKRALLSVAEQRARAAAWALEEANKKVVASSGSASTKRKNGASVADVVAPLKKDAVEDAISEARKEELERAEAAARSLTDTSNLPHESGRKRSRKSLTGERF